MKTSTPNYRFRPLASMVWFYIATNFIFRVVLFYKFAPHANITFIDTILLFLRSFKMDLTAAFWLFLPLAFWLSFIPNKYFFYRSTRAFLSLVFLVFLVSTLFLYIVEYAFFDEFNSRFNTVAVDYLIYPTEVLGNIWSSYPVAKLFLACLFFGLIFYRLMIKKFKQCWSEPIKIKKRFHGFIKYCLIGLLLVNITSMKKMNAGPERISNEVSKNGAYSFIYAALTHHLSFPDNYPVLTNEDAYNRTRELLQQPNAEFLPGLTIERHIKSTGVQKKAKNLVIILVESFGSEFWGCLGRPDSLTPAMDALSKEGILFTNLYASGNRTVRGMEGVLSSFPPLPGDSIVKRNQSDHVASLARVFKEKNYSTLFLYGGRGVFDGMRSYAVRNGYDRFIEQKDFKNPSFTTIWGVADEDLQYRAVEEFQKLYQEGKPFFGTVLTVSNHKPYSYPAGRISEDPNARSRAHAVKYTDWALGQFFERAKKEPFFKDTLFAVVADHGARVYGSQLIPIKSYQIPLLVIDGANPENKGTVSVLGGSLDVGPTLMGYMDLDYQSIFFGKDLRQVKPEESWTVMHHNYDIGFFRKGLLSVQGLNQVNEFYRLNPRTTDIDLISPAPENGEEWTKNLMGIFQVADELYTSEKYFPQKANQ